ncbi:MAG TPA: AraC family transcriptional regulator [Actinomycetota bacterium]
MRDPSERQASNRRLLRVRDAMDRSYADALDVEALARSAHLSRAHFIRSFRETFGETPHRYLQRRRIERAMALLREGDRPVTEICMEVGFSSLGTFSRTFHEIVGTTPTAYRALAVGRVQPGVLGCVAMRWDRPSSTSGEAAAGAGR